MRRVTRFVSIAALADALQPGERVFMPGSAGEPAALLAELAACPERSPGLRILSTSVPGINRAAIGELDLTAMMIGLLM